MIEAEAMKGDDTYTISELFSDLRRSVFSELRRAENINGYRRVLQRGYVERLQTLMDSEAGSALSGIDVSLSDIRMYVRGELESLKGQVDRASGRTRDNATRLHLRDLSERIDDILNPNA